MLHGACWRNQLAQLCWQNFPLALLNAWFPLDKLHGVFAYGRDLFSSRIKQRLVPFNRFWNVALDVAALDDGVNDALSFS